MRTKLARAAYTTAVTPTKPDGTVLDEPQVSPEPKVLSTALA